MKYRAVLEFHISRRARDHYHFDNSIFSFNGNVIFADFRAARVFAQKINQKRDLKSFPDQAVKPGQVSAMGLIDEILHYVIQLFRRECNENAMEEALNSIYQTLDRDEVDRTIREFTEQFPPVAVYRGEISLEDYISGVTGDTPNRVVVLEEMLLLWLANMNPAFSPFMEFFDDTALKQTTVYAHIISGLRMYFDTQPTFGPDNQRLVDMLRSPAVLVPNSLSGQLEYIRGCWGILLKGFIRRILGGLDLFKEEDKLTFPGPGKSRAYQYKNTGLECEAEEFSPDRDWMPRLVLMAKNIYVWLDQLSKKFGRSISRLDEIPDEELDTLSRQGFSGLWLIGVWERSPSSQKIKQLCGNPEAVPSAYSLYDYEIAEDLGGEEAYASLKERAWLRGIRLASDMVPNHVGIYSRWTIQHPDWFISLDYNPYPWYSFSGADLSHDERVGIFVEDHYYNRTDAAVVFKRVDRWTGSERYVYHGNDGTSMPWNDTAQIDYLNPEVREAMIQTILHVARKFPVIRFDAAMTLTKKHYQRLWFPEPGTGGAIPTRAEHGLAKEEFNHAMPKEFWREVVDRVASEAPDTLLLAEAFWLLEGYFVRTLGMHRVYNSAFMHMLRDEDNAGYRQTMKNTLEFDPEVLRRFVNFMNNPDERTAVDQFDKDGKYFGVCILMITMPGLPMFGHGQLEGLSEKYGMEYRRAYWDETPDPHLIKRHEREIFPLLRLRYLFAGVEHFLFYDFFTSQGHVNEDVFAYSNKHGGQHTVVAYHNKFAETAGWIKMAVAYSQKTGHGDSRNLAQKSLGEGLALQDNGDAFTIFRDHASNLQFIRKNKEIHEKGLYLELGAYDYHVFLDFREVFDNEWDHYSRLVSHLNGRGVPDIEKSLAEMLLQPALHAFRELMNASTLRQLWEAHTQALVSKDRVIPSRLMNEMEGQALNFLHEIKKHGDGQGNEVAEANTMRLMLESLLLTPSCPPEARVKGNGSANRETGYSCHEKEMNPATFYTLAAWVITRYSGRMVTQKPLSSAESRRLIDEWYLGPIITAVFQNLGMDDQSAYGATIMVKLLNNYENIFEAMGTAQLHEGFERLFADEEARRFLQVNEYEEILWFNRDSLRDMLISFLAAETVTLEAKERATDEDLTEAEVKKYRSLVGLLLRASERSGYRVVEFLRSLKTGPET
ncbi:MAG: hypothetical protein LBQ00_04095 [Syntrophobacterales bacterium]|jgi:glycosidase|nr:hypothetical protein [Syntrophobacterales bacterium]